MEIRQPDVRPDGQAQAGYLNGWFYGWYVVGAIMLVLAVCSGLGFYNLSVYLKAFVSHGGFSVEATSMATACFFVASGISGLGVGALIERYDVRLMMTAGALLSCVTMLGAGYVHELWQLYLFYALFGVGYSASALIPCTTLIARWFARRRSAALSIGSTGLSLGGILLTPVSARMISTLGLEGAAPWLALVFMVGIIPVTWIVIRPSPLNYGIGPDGDPIKRDEKGVPLPADGLSFDEAMGSRFFIFMTLTFILAMMAQVGTIAHLYNLVSSRTGSEDTGALALAVMAAASIVGRLIGGWGLAYISSRGFVVALILAQACVLVLFSTAQSTFALVGTSLLFGFTVGNMLMMAPLLCAEAFGLKDYGRIFSMNQLFTVSGVASGPLIMGLLYGQAGGYDVAFVAMALASVLAFLCIWAAGPVRAMIEGRFG